MLVLDIGNGGMRDFYNIWFMATTWDFAMNTLRTAILASCDWQSAAIPESVPFAFTEEFLNNPQKKGQWSAFARRLNPDSKASSPDEVSPRLRNPTLPYILPASPARAIGLQWMPNLGRPEIQSW